jgi:hypothetical protein
LTQVETDLARGEWTDPRAGRVSFAEWAGRWQETTTNLRPNTRARHGYLLRRLMLPAFGDTALADMAGRDAAIAAALDELIEAASTLARERRGVEATCDACLSLAGELGRRRGRW